MKQTIQSLILIGSLLIAFSGQLVAQTTQGQVADVSADKVAKRPHGMSAEEQQRHMQEMMIALDMSEEQAATFKLIHLNHMASVREMQELDLSQEDRRTRMQALRQDENKKVQALLTESQFTQYRQLNQERRKGRQENIGKRPQRN
jgi:hypothetical protein